LVNSVGKTAAMKNSSWNEMEKKIIKMRTLFEKAFPVLGVAVLLTLTLTLAPAIADSVGEDEEPEDD
jgi:hypothetical protein